MNKILVYIFLTMLFCFSISGQTMKLSGKITEVIDGNTLLLDASRNTFFKIRLQFIDPPEESQPLYDMVKKHLSSFVLNKSVVVEVKFMANGYHVGKVLADGHDLSLQLLRDGAAWYSQPEAADHAEKERKEYLEMESLAKAEKRGVWSIADLTPAWKLRIERDRVRNEQLKKEHDLAVSQALRGLLKTTKIGMSEAAFLYICGDEKGDSTTFRHSRYGTDVSYEMVYTDRRQKSLCFGSFSFENGYLASMSRNYKTQ